MGTAAEPVSPEDATLLCATGRGGQLQIGALCFFEGAPLRDGRGRLRLDDLRTHVEARLLLSPRYRQRIASIPFDAARPVWVDDAGFEIAQHVHAAVLPAPGGRAELRAFVADLLGRPLDPDKPLWDTWLVDGLEGDRVAVVLRVHHVMADGLSLLEAALLLLDPEPNPHPDTASGPWEPEPAPSPARLLWNAVGARRRHQVEIAFDAARFLSDPARVAGAARSAIGSITSPPGTAPSLSLNGRVGDRRDFLWASLPLKGLAAVKKLRGVTLNDVVLAVVTDALRRQPGVAAIARDGHLPRVLVPVGSAATDGESGNAFSFMVAALPVDIADPLLRLDRINL